MSTSTKRSPGWDPIDRGESARTAAARTAVAGTAVAGTAVTGTAAARTAAARTAVSRSERARRRRQDAEQEYRDEVYRQWRAAEAATNGYMLNRTGLREGIDERSLFAGPESRVRKYASPELIEWFESHPRPTRVSWFGSAAARRAHLAGRRIG